MKKVSIIIVCIICLLVTASCGKGTTEKNATQSAQAQMANPFQDCKSLNDAAKIAGFEMQAPKKIEGYPDMLIQAVAKEMIQVIYTNDDGEKVMIRKGYGTDDLSGDQKEYDQTTVGWAGDLSVTFKGEEDKVFVAYWFSDEHAFSFSTSVGMPRETIESLISAVQ